MVFVASSLLASALWLIFTPYSLGLSAIILLSTLLGLSLLTGFTTRFKHLNQERLTPQPYLLMILGLSLGVIIYTPALKDYQNAQALLPIQGEFFFQVIKKNDDFNQITIVLDKPKHPLHKKRITLFLEEEQVRTYQEGATYKASLSLEPIQATHRPNRSLMRIRLLSTSTIGRGKLMPVPPNLNQTLDEGINEEGDKTLLSILISPPSRIYQLREHIAQYFASLTTLENNAFFSALTVGKTDRLTNHDWDTLRKTGTIHLVSISGLHLTIVAFWSFLALRFLLSLFKPSRFAPYQGAALLSLGIAFFYAYLAGLSLPTKRALIMYGLAMTALLLYRPIFRLHTLALAFVIIILFDPFALLSIGFWLSFTAVTILILLSQYTLGTWKTLLLTQFVVSIYLMPLTAHFFGEISLISPFSNLFAIPWTTIFILPPLLIGTLLLPLSPFLSSLFFALSNLALRVLRYALDYFVALPYSFIKTPYLPFIATLLLTFTLLFSLAKIRGAFSVRKKLLTLTILFLFSLPMFFQSNKKAEGFYLLPVGEGLAALFISEELTFLYDTGRYFRAFDPGRDVILPTLHTLGATQLDTILLSMDNAQHTGGIRSVASHYPQAKLFTHKDLLPWVTHSYSCEEFSYINEENEVSGAFILRPLPMIRSSCSYFINYQDHLFLLLSDPTLKEWRDLLIDFNQFLNAYYSDTPPESIVILFPKQGQSRGYHTLPSFIELMENYKPTLLFSTARLQPEYSTFLEANTLPYLNAYHGMITVDFSSQLNSDMIAPRLALKKTNDLERFWWMR